MYQQGEGTGGVFEKQKLPPPNTGDGNRRSGFALNAVVLQAWDTAIIVISGLVAYSTFNLSLIHTLLFSLIPAMLTASSHLFAARRVDIIFDTSLKSTTRVVTVFFIGLLVSACIAVLLKTNAHVWAAYLLHFTLAVGALTFYRKRIENKRFNSEPRVAIWYPEYQQPAVEEEIREIIDAPVVGHYQNSISPYDDGAGNREGVGVLVRGYQNGDFDELLIHSHPATEIASTVVEAVSGTGIPFRFVPISKLGAVSTPVEFPLKIKSPMGRIGHFSKRILDISLSIIVLIFSTPLFIVIPIIIRLTSRGPVIFRQERVGKDGKHFTMYKFRSMRMMDDQTIDDPQARVTGIGRFIRKTSIDEIPQFVNVLKGDMSIIGPRPEMVHIVDRYTPIEKARLGALPGISGVWQLSPYRGQPIHYNVHCDLFYIRNQSIALDVVLMFQTLFWAFRGA